MGSRKGFLGESVLPFAIMLTLVRYLRPALMVHECTRTFRWQIFARLLPGYEIQPCLTEPADYGFPVRRERSYTALIRSSMFELAFPISEIHRLFIATSSDAGIFFGAPAAEAVDMVVK